MFPQDIARVRRRQIEFRSIPREFAKLFASLADASALARD